MKVLYLILLAIGSYLFGNINFAKIISRSKHDDITKHGSGNPGTLNMLRTYGFKWAIFNMLLEIGKGAIPTLVGKLWLGQLGVYVAGVAVILGHIFPVVSKFKGGKGVAAFAGFSLIALDWWVFLIVFAVCFTFVVITSIGSIGTLGFVLISTIIQLITINPSSNGWICYILLSFVATLIMYVHRGNIKRLFLGKENLTNIRAAFKKDFHLDKDKHKGSDEVVEVLHEAPKESEKVEETKVSALGVDNKVENDSTVLLKPKEETENSEKVEIAGQLDTNNIEDKKE